MTRIYLSPPHMTGAELELVKDAFASNWIAPLGPHVTAFTPCPSSLGRGEERNSPFEKGGKGDFDLRHAPFRPRHEYRGQDDLRSSPAG